MACSLLALNRLGRPHRRAEDFLAAISACFGQASGPRTTPCTGASGPRWPEARPAVPPAGGHRKVQQQRSPPTCSATAWTKSASQNRAPRAG